MSKYITYSIRRLDIKINRRHRVMINYFSSKFKLYKLLKLENFFKSKSNLNSFCYKLSIKLNIKEKKVSFYTLLDLI